MKGLVFTYVLTYGGAAFALFNPFTGLLVYVCFAILKPEALWYWAVPPGNYSRIVAIGLLVGWALHGFGDWSFGKARGVVCVLIGFWLWLVLSALNAYYSEPAWQRVEAMGKIVLPVLVGSTLMSSRRHLRWLAWTMVLSQGYLAFEFNLSYLQGHNRLVLSGFAGMEEKSVCVSMIACAGVGIFLVLDSPLWWQRLAALGSVVLMIHTPLFCHSRGGMLAMVVTGAVAFLITPKRPKHYLLLALIIVIGIYLAGPTVQEVFWSSFAEGDSRDESAQSRLELWTRCMDAIRMFPWLGLGPDNWTPWIAQQDGSTFVLKVHNTMLQVTVEQGLPALLLLVAFYGGCMRRLWPLTSGNSQHLCDEYRTYARMAIAGLTGFLVAAQFISLEGIEMPFYVTLLGIGALKLSSQESQQCADARLETDCDNYHGIFG